MKLYYEQTANQFAAALLMPDRFLRKDLARFMADDSEPEEVVDTLASKYTVSRRAMEFRLLNLGYISLILDED